MYEKYKYEQNVKTKIKCKYI